MRWVKGCMCVVGEKKKERQGYMGGGEKTKGNKKEKRNREWDLRVWWEKMENEKERRQNLKEKKLN